MKVTSGILIAALVTATACGGDGGTDPNGNGTDGTLSASITGYAQFTATVVIAWYTDQSRVLTITATEGTGANLRSISLMVNNVNGPGSYSLSLAGNSATYAEINNSIATSWLTAITQGSGSVVISQVSNTRVVATFSFSAPALSGATGTRAVSGQFNVVPSNPSF